MEYPASYLKRCLAILAIFVASQFSVQAQERAGKPGILLRVPVGARALSAGGAFTAGADDASAVYWNPAAIYLSKTIDFEFMNSQLGYDRSVSFAASTMPLSSDFGIGMYWTGFQISGIETRTDNSTSPDFIFDSAHHVLGLSVGHWLTYNTALGLTGKFFTTSLSDQAATGFGFDIGLRFEVTDRIVLGAVAQNLLATYRWETYQEKVPLTFRGGLAFRPNERLSLMMDMEQTSGSGLGMHFGVEFHAADTFPIRIGYDDGRLNGGFGFETNISEHDIGINYSYSNDRILNQGVHTFSLFLRLGGRRELTYSRNVGAKHIVVKTEVLNVRGGPGVGHSKIGKVLQGQRFEMLEKYGSWAKIRLADGRAGWVSTEYVLIIGG